MPTIESFTAYQYLSPTAYQRVREALVYQGHLFDWMVTETDLAEQNKAAVSVVRQVGARSYEYSSQNGYRNGHNRAHRNFLERYSTQDRPQTLSSVGWRLETDCFVLMGSEVWSLLLTAEAVDRGMEGSPIYRVGLTFDDWAISQFALLLQTVMKDSVRKMRVTSDSKKFGMSDRANDVQPLLSQKYSALESSHQHTLHAHSVSSRSQHQPLNRLSAKLPSIADQEKLASQEAFILSWARQIAALTEEKTADRTADKTRSKETHSKETHSKETRSKETRSKERNDEHAAQQTIDALQTQVQQSLLLDQVVTQIRHSLDLSDILETTVAQVRGFLSADRLVLYQFDRSMNLEDNGLSQSVRKASRAIANESTTSQASTSKSLSSSPISRASIGHSVVAGCVTYEARASKEISSVLHFAEEKCFTPSRLQRAKFLSGRPIAIDNVERQYVQTPCLLDFLKKAGVKSKIIAPVVVNGDLWGLLIAHQCCDYRHWEDTEVVFLQHIAEHLAVAVSQAQLYHQLQQQASRLKSRVEQRTQSLHDALMVAEIANVTKGEFLSTMSHELRTPLTYIIGMSATLLRWSFGELSDRQRSYLNTINQSGEQLLHIINNILDLAKVEAGQRCLDASEVSLSALFNSVLEQYDGLARSHGIALLLDSKLAPDEDLFWADKMRLQQIVENLTENAIKFTPEGGQVRLVVWREAQQVVFQVEDTGIGIEKSQQDGLFEKFKQLESPFARQYSGAGIGLAITKHLVEMHGGTIQVESQVDDGSTFTVCLPVQHKLQNGVGNHISDAFSNAKRIILLEQDEESAAIVCNMLTAAGFEVIWLLEAESLKTQLELLKPAMLIADLSLLSAESSQIKSLQLSITTLDTKVLALASSDSASMPLAHHDVLAKPIEPKTLLEKTRQLLPALP